MPNNRPPIKQEMKREIRQRCGFGCVICGLPLYEYEHMNEWAIVRRHVASEITLLCDRHHREKTNGLLPLATVQEADRDPYNKQAGISQSYPLYYSGSSCELVVGGSYFRRDSLTNGKEMIAIAIDREPLLAFTFEQDQLFLSLQVFDQQGNRVLWINENELSYKPTPWDIELVGRTLTVREASKQFLLEIKFSPPNSVEVSKGRFSFKGHELLIDKHKVRHVNTEQSMSGCGTNDVDVAIMVGEEIENVNVGFTFS